MPDELKDKLVDDLNQVHHLGLQDALAQPGRWNTAQLLDVVNHPLGPEWTPNELKDFASSKNYVEIVRGLDREDAAKLVGFSIRSVRLVRVCDSIILLQLGGQRSRSV